MRRKYYHRSNFDDRSLNFKVDTSDELESVDWKCTGRLNQGSEGSCTGHGMIHTLSCKPLNQRATSHKAVGTYYMGQLFDQWAGEDYSGSSVLGVSRVVHKLGMIYAYEWATSVEEILSGLQKGPCCAGVLWYSGMKNANGAGYITATGKSVGGHCVCIDAYDKGRDAVHIQNSWGKRWGIDGGAWLKVKYLKKLISGGEFCFPRYATEEEAKND